MTDSQTPTENRTMGEISHANPYTGEVAGRLLSRGPTVVADGGEPAATDSNGRTDTESTETMADVSHTPPNDAEDANRVFERGRDRNEGAEE